MYMYIYIYFLSHKVNRLTAAYQLETETTAILFKNPLKELNTTT